MSRKPYQRHTVEPQAARDARQAAAVRSYPSTRMNANDWFHALQADDALYFAILGDMARMWAAEMRRQAA